MSLIFLHIQLSREEKASSCSECRDYLWLINCLTFVSGVTLLYHHLCTQIKLGLAGHGWEISDMEAIRHDYALILTSQTKKRHSAMIYTIVKQEFVF